MYILFFIIFMGNAWIQHRLFWLSRDIRPYRELTCTFIFFYFFPSIPFLQQLSFTLSTKRPFSFLLTTPFSAPFFFFLSYQSPTPFFCFSGLTVKAVLNFFVFHSLSTPHLANCAVFFFSFVNFSQPPTFFFLLILNDSLQEIYFF